MVLGILGGGCRRFQIQQLESLSDVDAFNPFGFVSTFKQEFILIDVILNRTCAPVDAVSAVRGSAVAPVRSRDAECHASEADREF